jgi:hypothetical protein
MNWFKKRKLEKEVREILKKRYNFIVNKKISKKQLESLIKILNEDDSNSISS